MNTSEAQSLADARLLRLSTPFRDTFQNLFQYWVFNSYTGAAQHLHHLTPEQQEAFEVAQRKGAIKNLKGVQDVARFQDYGLDLNQLLRNYDRLFSRQDLVVSPSLTLPPDWYAKRVLARWSEYLDDRRGLGQRRTKAVTQIEGELMRGVQECWRRRQYFTRLEQIESCVGGGQARSFRETLVQAKILVVNSASYDEFEQYAVDDPSIVGGMTAVRNLSPLLSETEAAIPEGAAGAEPLAVINLAPLEMLSMADIVSFHTEEKYKNFRGSIEKLHQLQMRPNANIQTSEAESAVAGHLRILRHCVKDVLDRRGLKSQIESTTAEVFLRLHPAVASSIVAALMFALGVPAPTYVLLGPLSAFVLTKKTTSDRWREVEVVLREEICQELGL